MSRKTPIADVRVTRHAMSRWLERAAVHGDENVHDVVAAFHESRKVGRDDPVAFRRLSRMHYYYHEPSKTYFVVEPIGRECVHIVSVILPGGMG